MRVFENQIVEIGDPSINSGLISHTQVQDLFILNNRMKRNGIIDRDFLRLASWKSLKFLNFAGVISLDGLQIEILPKIFAGENPDDMNMDSPFLDFATMVSYVLKLKAMDIERTSFITTQKTGILELLIYFFSVSLRRALKEGYYRQYEKEIITSCLITGKVLFERQISRIDQSHIMQETHVHTENTKLMQFFRTCIHVFSRIVGSDQLREDLHKLLNLFEGVDLLPSSMLRDIQFQFTRLNEHYRNAYNQCRIILNGLLVNPASGEEGIQGVSFLFNMGRIFEDFLAEFLDRNIHKILPAGYDHTLFKQRSNCYLFTDNKSRPLRPDIRIESLKDGLKKTIILDTKYKILGLTSNSTLGSAKKGDLYQMYAYSTKYSASDTILVYPSLSRSSEHTVLHFETDLKFRLWTLNLSLFHREWEKKLTQEVKEMLTPLYS